MTFKRQKPLKMRFLQWLIDFLFRKSLKVDDKPLGRPHTIGEVSFATHVLLKKSFA